MLRRSRRDVLYCHLDHYDASQRLPGPFLAVSTQRSLPATMLVATRFDAATP